MRGRILVGVHFSWLALGGGVSWLGGGKGGGGSSYLASVDTKKLFTKVHRARHPRGVVEIACGLGQ